MIVNWRLSHSRKFVRRSRGPDRRYRSIIRFFHTRLEFGFSIFRCARTDESVSPLKQTQERQVGKYTLKLHVDTFFWHW